MLNKILSDEVTKVIAKLRKAEQEQDRIDTIIYLSTEYVRLKNEIERINHEKII